MSDNTSTAKGILIVTSGVCLILYVIGGFLWLFERCMSKFGCDPFKDDKDNNNNHDNDNRVRHDAGLAILWAIFFVILLPVWPLEVLYVFLSIEGNIFFGFGKGGRRPWRKHPYSRVTSENDCDGNGSGGRGEGE